MLHEDKELYIMHTRLISALNIIIKLNHTHIIYIPAKSCLRDFVTHDSMPITKNLFPYIPPLSVTLEYALHYCLCSFMFMHISKARSTCAVHFNILHPVRTLLSWFSYMHLSSIKLAWNNHPPFSHSLLLLASLCRHIAHVFTP